MSDVQADSIVGTTLAGKYRIVKMLGEGGMGCVYLAEQMMGSTVRKVALKTLHQHLSQDEKIRARFMRECGTIAELEHPNTIQVYDFGATDDGTLYIVMEYVQGKSLADILEQTGPMRADRATNILRQICGSLEEAHGRGIIHRDLKPDNVVLCEKAGQKDWVEVLDFGIAKRSEQDPNEAKLTQQGMVLGTPPYMSPEQFTGKQIDPRSDLYSLGIMAYEMLVGKLPFNANTAWEWATQHMTVPPSSFEIHPESANIPAPMKQAIMRCLAKDANERFANVQEFYAAFSAQTPSGQAAAIADSNMGRARTEMGAPMSPPGGYGPPPQQQPQQGYHPQTGGFAPASNGYPSSNNNGYGQPANGYGQPTGGFAPPTTPSAGGYAPGQMHGAPMMQGQMYAPQNSQQKKGGSGLLIAGGVVALLLVLGGGGAVAVMSKTTPDPVPTSAATATATTAPTADPTTTATGNSDLGTLSGGTPAPTGVVVPNGGGKPTPTASASGSTRPGVIVIPTKTATAPTTAPTTVPTTVPTVVPTAVPTNTVKPSTVDTPACSMAARSCSSDPNGMSCRVYRNKCVQSGGHL